MSGRRRRSRRPWFILGGIFVAVFLFTFLVHSDRHEEMKVEAASLEKFDPGYIISDYQMGNYNSMTEKEIQAFLTKKNPCNNKDEQLYNELTETYPNYSWHFENGHFICLSEEKFGDGEVIGSGETAAHIIWQTAQDYKINPQVLIVLLQKEQGLITDDFPHNIQYRAATGYGCPDTAPCSSQFYGFKNQVRKAAALFRTVLDGGWTNFPLGNNFIQYNPNISCGGSVVKIKNLATSALYRYTPYQPNAEALAAGYGTVESCGAYGNRNFYLYFEDWFGGITNEQSGLTAGGILATTSGIPVEDTDVNLQYDAHVQKVGWIGNVDGGSVAGSVGLSLRLEAFKIKLGDGLSGIEYRSYVENKGWEKAYKKDDEISGTTGQSLMLEAIQIKLNKELSKKYSVYYRVHMQSKGWMSWVKDGEIAGLPGQKLRVEAMQIIVVKKEIELTYSSHVQGIGWMDWVKNGEIAGTTGESRRMEAIKIKIDDTSFPKNSIYYKVHVQSIGWMDWVKNGAIAGTTGESRRMEAIRINLDEILLKKYNIYYRVHVEKIGWMDWVKNGEVAGTTGQSKRMEAIEIKIERKQ